MPYCPLCFLNSFGDKPVCLLKYFPKVEVSGKWRWSLIWLMVMSVLVSMALASSIT